MIKIQILVMELSSIFGEKIVDFSRNKFSRNNKTLNICIGNFENMHNQTL